MIPLSSYGSASLNQQGRCRLSRRPNKAGLRGGASTRQRIRTKDSPTRVIGPEDAAIFMEEKWPGKYRYSMSDVFRLLEDVVPGTSPNQYND